MITNASIHVAGGKERPWGVDSFKAFTVYEGKYTTGLFVALTSGLNVIGLAVIPGYRNDASEITMTDLCQYRPVDDKKVTITFANQKE